MNKLAAEQLLRRLIQVHHVNRSHNTTKQKTIIYIINLYSTTSKETTSRRSRPENTKPHLKRIIFKCLRKRDKVYEVHFSGCQQPISERWTENSEAFREHCGSSSHRDDQVALCGRTKESTAWYGKHWHTKCPKIDYGTASMTIMHRHQNLKTQCVFAQATSTVPPI